MFEVILGFFAIFLIALPLIKGLKLPIVIKSLIVGGLAIAFTLTFVTP